MTQYSVVVNPYSATEIKPAQTILINRYLISNVCLAVTKEEWERTWFLEGWRPVEAYIASNEKTFRDGDLVWCSIFGICSFIKGMPTRSLRKIILRPSEIGKISAARLSSLLALGETLSQMEFQKLKLK